tara:strand:- start:144 stop:1634 length:1491 start_codon:yes stop_codon:yes gene_type:complete
MEDLREENLNIDSKRVLSELKTGKIVCNIVFTASCEHNYIQLKDDVDINEAFDGNIPKELWLEKDNLLHPIKENTHVTVDDLNSDKFRETYVITSNESFDENKPFYECPIYSMESTTEYNERVIKELEKFIDEEEKKDKSEQDFSFKHVIKIVQDEIENNDWRTMFSKEKNVKLKVGTKDVEYKIDNHGGYDVDFNDNVSYAFFNSKADQTIVDTSYNFLIIPTENLPEEIPLTSSRSKVDKELVFVEDEDRTDLKLSCSEVIRMLKSGEYTIKVIVTTTTRHSNVQMKKGAIPKDEFEILKPINTETKDIIEEYGGVDELFYLSIGLIDENKPLYDPCETTTFEETFLHEKNENWTDIETEIESIEEFIAEKENEGKVNVLWGDYVQYVNSPDDVWSMMFTDENEEIKIGTEDYRIIKKGNFYDFDFKDYVECAIMVEDGPSEETVGVSYFIQPMPKKYITKEDSEDSNNKFCPSCLKQIIVPGNFCTNCGNKLI